MPAKTTWRKVWLLVGALLFVAAMVWETLASL